MNFVKMQGIGNDYVYVDCFKENVKSKCSSPIYQRPEVWHRFRRPDPDLPF